MKRLFESDISQYQKLGNFDEHLISFNSQVYGNPYIHEDKYLAYHDPLRKTVWLTLFELRGRNGEQSDRLECIRAAVAEFEPKTMMTVSPEKLATELDSHSCKSAFSDRDYQIRLADFDEHLKGGYYEDLRYRVKNAERRGYRFEVGRELTFAHSYILAVHVSKRDYNVWDYQAFLRLGNYVANSPDAQLFNVFLGDELIGFDVVGFLGDVLATPLGFCLGYPSLADFLMHNEVLYAKQHGYTWLDVGWACNPGLEEFKRKWKAVPRFDICVQEYAPTPSES